MAINYFGFSLQLAALPVILAFILQPVVATPAFAQNRASTWPGLLQEHDAAAHAPLNRQHNNVAAGPVAKPTASTHYVPFATYWIPETYVTYSYDALGRKTEELAKTYQHVNLYKITYSYDSHGNISEFFYYEWAWNSWQVKTALQHTTTYDTRGREADYLLKRLVNSTWTNDSRRVSEFNESGDLITTTFYEWKDSQWVPNLIFHYTYAASNTPPLSRINRRANEAGEMVNDVKIRYVAWHSFNQEAGYGKLSALEYQKWENEAWQQDVKIETVFGANNGSISTQHSWQHGAWVPEKRQTRAFEIERNIILHQDEDWIDNNWVVKGAAKHYHTYNQENQRTEELHQYWNEATQAFADAYKIVYSDFRAVTTAPLETALLQTQVYPNPASEKLFVRFALPATTATVRLTDLTGKVVLSKQLLPVATVQELDVIALPQGLYLLHLQDGNKVFTQKVLKQ